MKRYFPLILLFAVSIIAIPAIPVYFADQADASPEVSQAQEQESEGEEPTEGNAEESAEVYKVLDVSTGEVLDVPAVDYVIGAVCAEMPATFEPEALKAQAVAAHTYAARQHIKESENPTPELCGADFSNDTSKYQGYFTINQAKQYFGENFDENYGKIKAAAEEVCRYIITYNDEPIISAFHSMSSGTTESAQNVWGSAIEYLVPVDSSYDTNAPKYLEETAYDKEILQAKLSEAFPGIQLEDDFTKWLALGKISDSGTVLELKAGDKTVTGSELRSALSLRSACFDIRYEGNSIIFTTKGYGHGVGMSQYGANSMASQGSTWQEILEHYYPGCKITEA